MMLKTYSKVTWKNVSWIGYIFSRIKEECHTYPLIFKSSLIVPLLKIVLSNFHLWTSP